MATNTRLIPLQVLKAERPDWPFSAWWTGELVRRGELGCVRLGRRVFLTEALIEAYLARNISEPKTTAPTTTTVAA